MLQCGKLFKQTFLGGSMAKVLKIDGALYEVDDKTGTYRF